MSKHNDNHGLAINILKFQYYNFEFFNCQEIVLYETLMVLGGIHFAKKDEFYHSTASLFDKTGIKEHTLNKTVKKFKQLGILDYQIKGTPQIKHIRILWDNVLEMLPKIYQFDKVEEYFGGSTQPLIDFYKLLAENNEKIAENTEEKNSIKNNTEEYKEELKKEIVDNALAEEEEIAVKLFLEELREIFQNRIKQYNRDNEDQKDYTTLPIKKSVVNKMHQALKIKEETDIKNAFLAFSEEMLYMRVKPKLDAISYFLKEFEGEYPVIDKYQLLYIACYSTK
ncbi:MAG: hypothetical protein ACON4M_07090 [Crocinitomicaceae bacterium]